MKIFINYRRDDTREAAFIIAKSLMAKFGEANVFFDRQGISAGENFVDSIKLAFSDCLIFIPLIGKKWVKILHQRLAMGERDFVLEEISYAIKNRVIIIPLLLGDVEMPSKKDLPENLHDFSEIQATDISTNYKRLPRDLELLNGIVKNKLESIGKKILTEEKAETILQGNEELPTSTSSELNASWFMKTTTGPGERSGFGIIYDEAKEGIILDGGFGNENFKDLPEEKRMIHINKPDLNDTWIWNGSSWQFLQKKRLSFHNHAFTFNKSTQQNIIHGGWTGNQRTNETYVMTGDEWVKADANLNFNPGYRESHTMIYDDKRKSIILFGGLNMKLEFGQFTKANQIALGDTWEFNDSVWTKLHVKCPEPRWGHKMVYDESSGVIVLFGGYNGSVFFNDTWIWEGDIAEWSKITTENIPSARCNHAMTYDCKRKKVLLFGGKTLSNVPLNDLWEWNGNDWKLIIEHARPKPRYEHGFIYDKKRNKSILFGGSNGNEWFQDTWELSF